MKLYQYDHCPYCVRADMVANYKNIPHEKVYLLNDDEQSCYDLVDAKVCPILQFDDGSAMKESLDIVAKLDELGDTQKVITSNVDSDKYEAIFAPIKPSMRILTYPRTILIGLPEFETQSARDYFQHKKQKMIHMSFAEAMNVSAEHLVIVNTVLAELACPELKSKLSMDDIILYPTLRNLSMVQGINFPPATKAYMHHIAKLTETQLYFHKAL